MSGNLPGMTLKAIGFVANEVKQPPEPEYNWPEAISEITIDAALTESLENLEEFSHIIVLYWMHQLTAGEEMPPRVHPRGDPELPLVGRFATRSPRRPNLIGKAVVRLLERRGNILRVAGLDAIDGTPVIDIKPYIPGYDSVIDSWAPSWATSR